MLDRANKSAASIPVRKGLLSSLYEGGKSIKFLVLYINASDSGKWSVSKLGK